MDSKYDEYLIYEAYPILSGSSQLSIREVGEESSLLDNVTPYLVSIELIDASIYINEFILSGEEPYEPQTKGALILQQAASKIDRINEHIRINGEAWIAGETSISRLSFQEKKYVFGGQIPNLQGFEYYVGGVFLLPGALSKDQKSNKAPSEHHAEEVSPFASEFSWTNRHGENWVTQVKIQMGNDCWAFGSTAAAELLVNLFFNRHLDYDLSEQNLVYTCGTRLGGLVSAAFEFMQETGIVLEECFPYTVSFKDRLTMCEDPMEQIRISKWEKIVDEESKKRAIISGTATGHIINWGHAAQVVGYKVLEPGDVHNVKISAKDFDPFVIEANSPLIGETAWLIKNSWGESWGENGFGYVIAGDHNLSLYAMNGSVESLIYNDSDILCTDLDGDGFYNWGIGPKPAHCPDCPDTPDGDDADPCISSMDEFGNLISITPTPEAKDTMVLEGQIIPDFYVSGDQVRWYGDSKLQNQVHAGNRFPAKHSAPGDYSYYVTQTRSGCESAADKVVLSIISELPPPSGHDTVIIEGKPAVLSAIGLEGAELKWYEDPQLSVLLDSGVIYKTAKIATGIYSFYVTQTKCLIESAPDTVVLEIIRPASISDLNLLNKLIQEGVDTNGDKRISYSEAEPITSLNVSKCGIYDLTGMEAFVNLETLDCSHNKLGTLEISKNIALRNLLCSDNRLTTLEVSYYPALEALDCSFNEISALDLSNNPSLASLDCSDNRLNSMDVSHNPKLTELICRFNMLTSLDISNNLGLRYLNCAANNISNLELSQNKYLEYLICPSCSFIELDVSKCTALTYLNCNHNQLSTMDVSDLPKLDTLLCYGNQLESLDVTNNAALATLGCGGNQLTSLNVSKNTSLVTLECGGNRLSSLDLRKNIALEMLYCFNSQISDLNVSTNRKLKSLICTANQLKEMDVSNCIELDTLKCDENQLTSLDISNNPLLGILFCDENQLTSLDVTNNTSLFVLECGRNRILSLDISNNTELCDLRINDMPSLQEVCVWEMPFPTSRFWAFDRTGSPNVEFTTGCSVGEINDYEIETGLLIYPNPCHRLLNLDLIVPKHYSIRISSLSGQLIYEETLDGSVHQIDLSLFRNGVYFIQIGSKDSSITKKIIKH